MFTIGILSRDSGCPIETIRYYEKLGLLPQPQRSEAGHRLYNKSHLQRLAFILKARGLGFNLAKTGELLSLTENKNRPCSEALSLVDTNIQAISAKLLELQAIKESLSAMSTACKTCCPNAKAPDCTIIESLFSQEPLELDRND